MIKKKKPTEQIDLDFVYLHFAIENPKNILPTNDLLHLSSGQRDYSK